VRETEKGKRYRIFYDDGENRIRDKILVFQDVSNGFFVFFNDLKGVEESILINRIVRYEEARP